jgi:hypothetical protein
VGRWHETWATGAQATDTSLDNFNDDDDYIGRNSIGITLGPSIRTNNICIGSPMFRNVSSAIHSSQDIHLGLDQSKTL